MYLIICLYAALLLTACGSDKEPLFRPTVPAAPAPAATDKNADSRAPDKPSAPSPKTETLTTDTGYSGGYDSDIYITSGYTQSTEVWFPQTPGIGDNNHPKQMVFRLLGEDTAKAYPFSRLEACGQRAAVNDDFENRKIVFFFQADMGITLALDHLVDERTRVLN